MQFEPLKRTTATRQVVDSIRDAVLAGRLRVGERIASERDLAAQFGVNRATIREALALLSALGLVEVRHGDGTRVARPEQASPQLIPHLLGRGGQIDPEVLADLLDVRALMLEWAARRAADRATARGAAELAELATRLDRATEPTERQELDFQFFEALVALAGNRVFSMLLGPIRTAYAMNRGVFTALFADPLFDPDHYARISGAVESGDADEAARAMSAFAAVGLALIDPGDER